MIKKLILLIPLTLLLGDHLGFIPQWNITTMKKSLSNQNIDKEYIYLSDNLDSEHFYDQYGNIEKSIYNGGLIINYTNTYKDNLLIKRKDDYIGRDFEFEYDENKNLIKKSNKDSNRSYPSDFIYEYDYDKFNNIVEFNIIESGILKLGFGEYSNTVRTIYYKNEYDSYDRLKKVTFKSTGNKLCTIEYEYLGEYHLYDYVVSYYVDDVLEHKIQYDKHGKIVVDFILIDGKVVGGLDHFYE